MSACLLFEEMIFVCYDLLELSACLCTNPWEIFIFSLLFFVFVNCSVHHYRVRLSLRWSKPVLFSSFVFRSRGISSGVPKF